MLERRMKDLDRESGFYARFLALAESLWPLSPLSELARCYEDVVESTEEGKENE